MGKSIKVSLKNQKELFFIFSVLFWKLNFIIRYQKKNPNGKCTFILKNGVSYKRCPPVWSGWNRRAVNTYTFWLDHDKRSNRLEMVVTSTHNGNSRWFTRQTLIMPHEEENVRLSSIAENIIRDLITLKSSPVCIWHNLQVLSNLMEVGKLLLLKSNVFMNLFSSHKSIPLKHTFKALFKRKKSLGTPAWHVRKKNHLEFFYFKN